MCNLFLFPIIIACVKSQKDLIQGTSKFENMKVSIFQVIVKDSVHPNKSI